MQIELGGLRALVTGSTRGIGHAIARRLAGFGAEVAINGRTADATAQAIEQLARTTPEGRFVAAAGDLGEADGAEAVFAAAGAIDILVNNAGIFGTKDAFALTDDDWTDMFRINVLSAVRATRHFGPRMAAKGWGRIVNIGSEAGAMPLTELVHYSASKAAMHAMSRGFAQALAGTGVTVNTVLVGPTAHDGATAARIARAAAVGLDLPDFERKFFAEQRPSSILNRYVEADEIADLVAFLVSREAGFASGAPWRADCGNLTAIA